MRGPASWVLLSVAATTAVACGAPASSSTPRLDAITPARVSSLIATPATIEGAHLYARARVALDGPTPPTLDARWQIAIGAHRVPATAVTWHDPTQLALVVPGGLTAGVHDVVATAPDGREVVLADGLTVSDEPIGLRLAIEDAPGGLGASLGGTLVAGDTRDAFAVVRDGSGAFVADIEVSWGMTAAIGTITVVPTSHAMFTARRVGTGRLTVTRITAELTAESEPLVVVAGPPTALAIVDAPGGGGLPIGDVAGLTTDLDGGLDGFAVAVDGFGNYVRDEAAAWSLEMLTGILPAASQASVVVDFTTTGTGVLHADHPSLGRGSTGTLTVTGGRAAALTIAPPTAVIGADAPPLTFVATGRDDDGNATTDLGTLTWSVTTGPITALAPSTGVLDPAVAGTGTLRATSSWGAIGDSGPITITPGRAASLDVTPASLTISADDGPRPFVATGHDADGNVTLDLGAVTWTIAAGPIALLAASTGIFDPRTAGVGVVRATSSWGPTDDASVTVTPGVAAALVVSPTTVDRVVGEPPVAFSAAATDADGNATTALGTLTWSVASGTFGTLDAAGVLTPQVPGAGQVGVASSWGPSANSGAVRVRRPAALVAAVSVPPSVSIGQTFMLDLRVVNVGESDAVGVAPCTLPLVGPGGATIASGPTPATATIAAGANAYFRWSLTATAAGSLRLDGCASGADAVTGAAATSPTVSAVVKVQTPPVLVAALTIPPQLSPGSAFTATLTVTNTGGATASAVVPATPSLNGTGGAMLVGPAPAPATILAAGMATFTWRYQATSEGQLQLATTASGTDANSGAAVVSNLATSNTAAIDEASLIATDPFGDGTAFAYVTGYRDNVVLGPSADGAHAARFAPTGGAVTLLDFTFTRDDTGNASRNAAAPPYRSIGAAGCTPNTYGCGPDNEDGRGRFSAVTFGGDEWLLIAGARSAGDFDYVYMTNDSDPTLDFRYVDLSVALGGNTRSLSAVAAANKMYLGCPDNGGSRPFLVELNSPPSAPGSNPGTNQATDLGADKMPGFQTAPIESIDTLEMIGSRLHVFQKGAWIRAVGNTPKSYESDPADWLVITPSSADYTALTSIATTVMAGLRPTDRAIPQVAVFAGRVYVARNTTAGPQLWSCAPATSGDPAQCEAADWTLIARNALGNPRLSQFDDPTRSAITMLVATPTHLYVGLDDADGLVVYRTSNPTPSAGADFVGHLGCTADQGPAVCAGLGAAGLGDARNTRIHDARTLTFGTTSAVYVTVGDGVGPLSVYALR